MSRFKTSLILAPLSLSLLAGSCSPQQEHPNQAATKPPKAGPAAGQLQAVYQGDIPWTGVAVSDAGRAFVLYPHLDGEAGLRVAEMKAGKPVPYPNAAWNDWRSGQPTAHTFVRVNSLRIGPDGLLWVVDTGTPHMGGLILPGGPKLVGVDLTTNQVARIIPLDKVLHAASFVDDVRFQDNTIYLTDAGDPALVVLDKTTGEGRRVLEHDTSTTDRQPLYAEGRKMTSPDGQPVLVHVDQLEVSPDGKYLYFQPVSGPLSRIETRFLRDSHLPAAELSRQVQPFYPTPTTGGTAIDAAGNLYVTDVDKKQILRITPAGQASTLVQDERLIWADALWIDKLGNLWIPAAQLNRQASLNGGINAFKPPVYIYKLPIGAKPFRS
jgi:sugar lactone lactonase YvrE